jgi:hypothetical protein
MVKKHNDNLFSVGIPGGISILTGKEGIKLLEEAIKNKAMENRINIEVIDLKFQKIHKGSAFLEFGQKVLRYRMKFLATQPRDKEDLSLGEVEKEIEWECCAKKEAIVAVDMFLMSPEDFDQYWNVQVSIQGRYEDMDLYFKLKDKPKAMEIQRKIMQWAFGEE